jgi:hypothetical protein
MLILEIYVVLAYFAGILFSIMTISNDRSFTVADLIMLLLAPFAMMPILIVHLVSQFVDVDEILFRL